MSNHEADPEVASGFPNSSSSDTPKRLGTSSDKDDRPSSPPSHILADGTHVHLPGPTPLERSSYFQRAIASRSLVSATGRTDKTIGEDGDTEEEKDGEEKKEEDKEEEGGSSSVGDPNWVHPLAVASARLRGGGISELSKAINLAGLVGTGEYFSLATIVRNDADASAGDGAAGKKPAGEEDKPDAKGKDGAAPGGDAAAAAGGAAQGATTDGKDGSAGALSAKEEGRMRARYILKRKRDQFDDAAKALDRHMRRLSRSIQLQRVVDRRLLRLRKRWRLAAPEHGTRVVGPVRPNEVISIDVEIYNRDRVGGHSATAAAAAVAAGGGAGEVVVQKPGRLARMVPRYATVELEQKKKDDDDDDDDDKGTPPSTATSTVQENTLLSPHAVIAKRQAFLSKLAQKYKTVAEPYAVADPALGELDPFFDPDKVPMLTLVLLVEKNSTGFTQSATLSSSDKSSKKLLVDMEEEDEEDNQDQDPTDGTSKKKKKKKKKAMEDEALILKLQHSLFCASLFDTIRQEIANTGGGTSLTGGGQALSTSARPTVWLSSEMDETFLPAPAHMSGAHASSSSSVGGVGVGVGAGAGAGAGASNHLGAASFYEDDGQSCSFCVVHCHEGEVKVQLDAEYALTFRLVESGSGGALSQEKDANDNDDDDDDDEDDDEEKDETKTNKNQGNNNVAPPTKEQSGSMDPDHLRALCRALLLHSQFIYHDFCKKTKSHKLAHAKEEEDPKRPKPPPLSRKKVKEMPSPRILQQCISFGAKVLFDVKIRAVLSEVSRWVKENYPNPNKGDEEPLQVDWLPLSFFDCHSHVALRVGDDFCADVHVVGGSMRVVTHSGDTDMHRSVRFASADEFRQYLYCALRSALGPPSLVGSSLS